MSNEKLSPNPWCLSKSLQDLQISASDAERMDTEQSNIRRFLKELPSQQHFNVIEQPFNPSEPDLTPLPTLPSNIGVDTITQNPTNSVTSLLPPTSTVKPDIKTEEKTR